MIKMILKYVKKYWYLALCAPIFMILEVSMDMFLNQYMEKMIDYGIQNSNLENVIHYGVIMIGILIVGVITGICAGIFTNLAAYKSTNDLRKDVFKKIMNLSYHQTDKFSTSSLIVRVTNDITQIQQMISMTLRGLVRSLSMFILGIIFTLSIDPRFGLILAIVLPIEIVCMLIFMKKVFPIFGIMQKKMDNVNNVVHENLTGARVVKAFNKEDYEDKRFKDTNQDYVNVSYKIVKNMSIIMPILMVLIYGAQLVMYSIGGNSIIDFYHNLIGVDEMLLVGEISQAVTYITMICMSLMSFGMMLSFFARASASTKRIKEVLDCELEIVDGPYNDLSRGEGTIEFKNVSFTYPDDKGKVLDDISFKVNHGETIAIVGATGCGKSTLVNLITRFYDVSDGEILINNRNIKEYNQINLRDRIAICLQKSELFAGSIEENIRWGKQDASHEEVVLAANIAQASEFIESKEDKYEEYVEEKGTSLSGGQKQRLAIARAIVKRPEILIFDDSTSALDLVTEAKLYKAMKEHISDVTKIVVAQRVATAKNADRIMVLENGRIVDFDTHEKLLKNCKVYQDIYNSQLKGDDVIYED